MKRLLLGAVVGAALAAAALVRVTVEDGTMSDHRGDGDGLVVLVDPLGWGLRLWIVDYRGGRR